jgi:hypothetical protein
MVVPPRDAPPISLTCPGCGEPDVILYRVDLERAAPPAGRKGQ